MSHANGWLVCADVHSTCAACSQARKHTFGTHKHSITQLVRALPVPAICCCQTLYGPRPSHLHILFLTMLPAAVLCCCCCRCQAFYSPRPAKLQRRGGCRSLQAEFDSTGSSSLMWRRSSQELAAALSSSSSEPPAIQLRGPAGAGKSIAVVQLVEWARNNGW